MLSHSIVLDEDIEDIPLVDFQKRHTTVNGKYVSSASNKNQYKKNTRKNSVEMYVSLLYDNATVHTTFFLYTVFLFFILQPCQFIIRPLLYKIMHNNYERIFANHVL